MKLLSIDIETTGLDPKSCSCLEIGAVIFDPQPEIKIAAMGDKNERRPATFERLIRHSRFQGEAVALSMNSDVLLEIAGKKDTHIGVVTAPTAMTHLQDFIVYNTAPGEKVTIVGKNFDAFDRRFLEKLPGWDLLVVPLCERRTLDVGSLYFSPEDGKVVSLDSCLDKIGCSGLVTHRALDDALAVMTAITRFFN